MLFRGKDQDLEVNICPTIDLCFWSILFQICYISTPTIGRLLRGGGALCFRLLCFGVTIEWWKWAHEVIDVNGSILEILE